MIERFIKNVISAIKGILALFIGIISLLIGAGTLVCTDHIIGGTVFTLIGLASSYYGVHTLNSSAAAQITGPGPAKIKGNAAKPLNQGNLSGESKESFSKAVNDFNSINDITHQLKNQYMINQLCKLQDIASRMITYMRNNPAKIPLAHRFINYYQDRVLSLSRQFLEFEQLNLNTADVQNIKGNIISTLYSFDEAYEAQFSKILSDKLMEMEAELKVVHQVLEDDGIKSQQK